MDLRVFYISIVLGLAVSTAHPQSYGRIVGGEPADIKEIPYQLALKDAKERNHICGASIISASWAVSAAHCFQGDIQSRKLILVAGTSSKSTGGSVHPIVKHITHPSYNDKPSNNDIAVFQVSKPFPLGTAGVSAISLALSPPPVSVLAQTSGWGSLTENGGSTDQLQKVLVPILDNNRCSAIYGGITAQMICAGFDEGGKDSCYGDSGGPLVYNNQLIGIVSFGLGCARPQYPGVYARVDKLAGWVQQVTGISQ